jgi:hypothetical protein
MAYQLAAHPALTPDKLMLGRFFTAGNRPAFIALRNVSDSTPVCALTIGNG